MENIYRFPDRGAVAEEAVAWLVRLDGDTPPSPEELQAFREWLGRSPVHREEVDSLNAFWANNILTELMVPLGKHREEGPQARPGTSDNAGTPGASDATRAPGSPGTSDATRDPGSHAPARQRIPLLATAATVVLATALALAIGLLPNPVGETNGLYMTAVGQQKTVTLEDGSTLQLNTNSQVKVDFNDHYRNVQLLQGEVHFQVAKLPAHPFRVYAGGGRVQAVGTAFTVYLNNKDMNVLVTEGRVALASLRNLAPADKSAQQPDDGTSPTVSRQGSQSDSGNKQSATGRQSTSRRDDPAIDPYVKSATRDLAIIDAGESITVNIADGSNVAETDAIKAVQKIDADDLHRRQSWRQGLLVFAGEPLEQVIDEVGRYTTVKIELADPALGKIQIGGRFQVGDIEGMFAALKTNFGVEITRLNYDRVLLSAAQRVNE